MTPLQPTSASEKFDIFLIHAHVRWNDFRNRPAVRWTVGILFAVAVVVMIWADVVACMLLWPDGGFGR